MRWNGSRRSVRTNFPFNRNTAWLEDFEGVQVTEIFFVPRSVCGQMTIPSVIRIVISEGRPAGLKNIEPGLFVWSVLVVTSVVDGVSDVVAMVVPSGMVFEVTGGDVIGNSEEGEVSEEQSKITVVENRC